MPSFAITVRDAEKMLATIAAVIVVLDPDGTIVFVNDACRALTGYEPEDLVGRSVWDLLPAEEAPAAQAVFAELRSGRFPTTHTNRWLGKDGRAPVIAWSNTCLLADDGSVRHIVGTGVDITRSAEAEVELGQAQRALVRASRLAELGAMTTAITHELSQPLTAVRNYMEITRNLLGRGDTTAAAAMADRASVQMERANAMVHKLNELASPWMRTRATQDLNALVREAAKLGFLGAAASGVKTRLELASDLPEVDVDLAQIRQVIVILLHNAIDAMEESDTREVVIETRRAGENAVEVVISHLGPGLPQEIIGEIYQPFVSTKADGFGLGLSIARSIIEGHGGRIWHTPREGGGTSFHFSLPTFVARAAPQPFTATEPAGDHSGIAGKTVYVVEDDEAVREALCHLLEHYGVLAEAYASAQAFFDARAGTRDGCLLVDIVMPGMSGLELHARLSAHGIDLPVCFISGYADVPLAVQAMKGGAVDVLQKPFSGKQLLDCIETAFRIAAGHRALGESAEEAAALVDKLSARELEVFRELVAGNQNKAIARQHGISPRTVEKHRARIMAKLNANNLSKLVRIALAAGVTPS